MEHLSPQSIEQVKIENPRQRVFGDTLYFAPESDAVTAFYEERIAKAKQGEVVWLPRQLDVEHGSCADLVKDGKVLATLEEEYGYGTNVYTTSDGGTYGDTLLCEQVTFEDAVKAAEELANQK